MCSLKPQNHFRHRAAIGLEILTKVFEIVDTTETEPEPEIKIELHPNNKRAFGRDHRRRRVCPRLINFITNSISFVLFCLTIVCDVTLLTPGTLGGAATIGRL